MITLIYLSQNLKLLSFVGQRTMRRATADFHSRQKYFQAIEHVLNRLHHQNSFQQQFNILRVEEVIADCEGIERSHTGNQVQPFQLNSEIEGIK